MNTEYTASSMKTRAVRNLLFLFAACAVLFACLSSCKVSYSFTGASISPEIKTFTVKPFSKTASLGPASLRQTLTEKLKDKFISQTSLAPVDQNGDLVFEGTITSYSISPISIQANETAAKNRLTISVNVKFTNIRDEKQNFEATFTRYEDYTSTLNLAAVEEGLITTINEQLVDDIFNKAVINW
jgi:hypothetical protein